MATTFRKPSSSPVATMLSVTISKEKIALLYNSRAHKQQICEPDAEADLGKFRQTGTPQKKAPMGWRMLECRKSFCHVKVSLWYVATSTNSLGTGRHCPAYLS